VQVLFCAVSYDEFAERDGLSFLCFRKPDAVIHSVSSTGTNRRAVVMIVPALTVRDKASVCVLATRVAYEL
jgi:hypothetical protein